MGSVYLLTLRQLAGKWRLLIMTALAAMPVLVTMLTMRAGDAPSVVEFEVVVLSTLLVGSIVPLVVLAIGSAAFGNELEDRTLANLTLAPIPRWQIAVPKLLAAVTMAGSFIGVSTFLTGNSAFLGDTRAIIAVTLSSVVSVALYAAAFVWLGLVSPRAIGIGLAYIIVWEGFFSGFVSGIRLLSIRHYSMALAHGIDPRRFAEGEHPGLVATVVVSVVLLGGFLGLTVRRLKRMDVP